SAIDFFSMLRYIDPDSRSFLAVLVVVNRPAVPRNSSERSTLVLRDRPMYPVPPRSSASALDAPRRRRAWPWRNRCVAGRTPRPPQEARPGERPGERAEFGVTPRARARSWI